MVLGQKPTQYKYFLLENHCKTYGEVVICACDRPEWIPNGLVLCDGGLVVDRAEGRGEEVPGDSHNHYGRVRLARVSSVLGQNSNLAIVMGEYAGDCGVEKLYQMEIIRLKKSYALITKKKKKRGSQLRNVK